MNELIREFYRSIDDGFGGEIGEDAPEDASSAESRPTGVLSPEAIAISVREALKAEISDARIAPVPRQQGYTDPSTESLRAMRLQSQLDDEIEEILAEMPSAVRKDVKQQLRQFDSLEQLQVVKDRNVHKTLADAAIGKAIGEGTYSPGQSSAPWREPVHSEPASRIPSEYRREQEEVCRILGVKLSEKELREAWRSR